MSDIDSSTSDHEHHEQHDEVKSNSRTHKPTNPVYKHIADQVAARYESDYDLKQVDTSGNYYSFSVHNAFRSVEDYTEAKKLIGGEPTDIELDCCGICGSDMVAFFSPVEYPYRHVTNGYPCALTKAACDSPMKYHLGSPQFWLGASKGRKPKPLSLGEQTIMVIPSLDKTGKYEFVTATVMSDVQCCMNTLHSSDRTPGTVYDIVYSKITMVLRQALRLNYECPDDPVRHLVLTDLNVGNNPRWSHVYCKAILRAIRDCDGVLEKITITGLSPMHSMHLQTLLDLESD